MHDTVAVLVDKLEEVSEALRASAVPDTLGKELLKDTCQVSLFGL
jgi:hypothetical protein